MDRLTLDQEGARTGRLYAHSLQMGDDTVTLSNIATMGVEKHKFRPYDTPRNRSTMRTYLGFASVALVLELAVFAWWAAGGFGLLGPSGIVFLAGLAVMLVLGGLGLRVYARVRHVQDYFRLRIGASDGQQLYLVDDNRRVLEEIRDALRQKIDSRDEHTVGSFDLNADTLALSRAGAPS